jgi:uncharacterized protein YndB with AHSA1/START domain
MSVTIEKSLQINASAGTIWKALADFAAIAEWAPNCDHSSWASEQRDGIGALRRVQVGRIAVLETVVEWEPDVALAYQLTGLPPQAGHVVNRWSLSPAANGTLVTLTTTIDPLPGPPGAIIARVLSRQLAKADQQMLAGLAVHLGNHEESS